MDKLLIGMFLLILMLTGYVYGEISADSVGESTTEIPANIIESIEIVNVTDSEVHIRIEDQIHIYTYEN